MRPRSTVQVGKIRYSVGLIVHLPLLTCLSQSFLPPCFEISAALVVHLHFNATPKPGMIRKKIKIYFGFSFLLWLALIWGFISYQHLRPESVLVRLENGLAVLIFQPFRLLVYFLREWGGRSICLIVRTYKEYGILLQVTLFKTRVRFKSLYLRLFVWLPFLLTLLARSSFTTTWLGSTQRGCPLIAAA